MKIKDTVALVTGANRGIGFAFTQELLARGARKVYAGARDPSTVKQSGVEVIRLDVTKPDQIAVAAARAADVALLINNAGIVHQGGFLAPDSEEVARRQRAASVGRSEIEARVEQQRQQRPLPRWVGKCQAAADRAALADRVMADRACAFRQDRAEALQCRRPRGGAVPYQRADHDTARILADHGEFVEIV